MFGKDFGCRCWWYFNDCRINEQRSKRRDSTDYARRRQRDSGSLIPISKQIHFPASCPTERLTGAATSTSFCLTVSSQSVSHTNSIPCSVFARPSHAKRPLSLSNCNLTEMRICSILPKQSGISVGCREGAKTKGRMADDDTMLTSDLLAERKRIQVPALLIPSFSSKISIIAESGSPLLSPCHQVKSDVLFEQKTRISCGIRCHERFGAGGQQGARQKRDETDGSG